MQSTNSRPSVKPPIQDTRLDRRYGEISISAVAAAVRYQCENKNPAYAPVVNRPLERDNEAA